MFYDDIYENFGFVGIISVNVSVTLFPRSVSEEPSIDTF